MKTDKIFNNEAEFEILGAVMHDNDSLSNIIDFLMPEDFYNIIHSFIYEHMVGLYKNSIEIDPLTLADSLGSKLSETGGITFISKIAGECYTSVNIFQHAKIVKEKSNTRKLIKALNDGILKAQNTDETSEEILSRLQDKLNGINNYVEQDNGEIEKSITRFIDDLETRCKNGGDINGIKCGYRGVDRMLGGLKPEDLIIIAGRPSMGKTAVTLNIAINTAVMSNAKAAFFNLEMGKQQILERMMSITTEINMESIKNGKLKDENWDQIVNASSKLIRSNIRLYDKLFTLNSIKAECKKLKMQKGLDIVIIDYLQLIEMGGKAENRNMEISKISRELKLMAKELEVTVVALSQLSRAPESRREHRPLMSDLRESGSIEQDADVVAFLYRDGYYNKDTDSPDDIEFIVAKNRNGEVGTVKLRWKPECQKVEQN